VNETDPRVKRTRKLIQDAFAELLSEKSFHAISVQDIAERATVNRATFYAHFEDKYALLEHVVGEWFREALDRRVTVAVPLTPSNLQLLIVAVMEAFADFRRHCKPVDRSLDPLIESRVQRELEAFLATWLKTLPRTEGGKPATRDVAATVLSWAIFGAAVEWSRGPNAVALDSVARQVLATLVNGVGSWIEEKSRNGAKPERDPRELAEPAEVGHR
jgi:AcrR family transcriptional regulator